MIEFFKQPNIDWMGKAKYFYALSGFFCSPAGSPIFSQGGIRYGIDFKGGTNVDVRFAQPPNIDKLRSGLAAQGLGNSEIQSISDIANPNANEVVIFVEQKGQDDQALDASRTQSSHRAERHLRRRHRLQTRFQRRDANVSCGRSSPNTILLLLSVNAGDRYSSWPRKFSTTAIRKQRRAHQF